jgi:glycosyltransferase involved in cell wall biosynthesis
MKIAYFTDTFVPEVNGVTNTLSKLGVYLDEKQNYQLVIAPDYDGNNPNVDSESRKVRRFKGITTSLSPKSRLAFPMFWDIDKICDAFKPDIVHVTTELGIGFRGMRYALARNIPLVMSFHTDYIKYLKYHSLEIIKPLLENYLAWFYSFPSRTLAPSRYTYGELRSKGYRNLEIWSRGIDADSFNSGYRNNELRDKLLGTQGGAEDKFIFLYVGRLSAEKSLDMLIFAASEIERRFPGRTAFVFTGDGPYADVIKSRNLPNTVLTGFLRGRELSEMYASSDCFAFPSATETFGNVVLEAMASGLPVAGVESGGVTDFLSHDQNALLCSPEDVSAFTENLVAIMEDEGLRVRLGEEARKTALTRDWNRIFDWLVEVYDEIIQEFKKEKTRQTA